VRALTLETALSRADAKLLLDVTNGSESLLSGEETPFIGIDVVGEGLAWRDDRFGSGNA